jgi:hypothetical protein
MYARTIAVMLFLANSYPIKKQQFNAGRSPGED